MLVAAHARLRSSGVDDTGGFPRSEPFGGYVAGGCAGSGSNDEDDVCGSARSKPSGVDEVGSDSGSSEAKWNR